jgi:hypothetical protein
MSAEVIVLSSARSGSGDEVPATRRAWRATAWFSSRTASRALPDRQPPSASARTAAALLRAATVSLRPASSARAEKIADNCPGG